MPALWGCYVTVDNVDQTLEKCLSLGGRVMVPPMDVPNVGRMAVIQDPQGAVINVMAYNAM
jgi:predicted enzyme related to lactoylglutathione lyase